MGKARYRRLKVDSFMRAELGGKDAEGSSSQRGKARPAYGDFPRVEVHRKKKRSQVLGRGGERGGEETLLQ